MNEIGEVPYLPKKRINAPKKPHWKQTSDEIDALRKKREEAVQRELFARSKELLKSAGILDAGIYLAQEIWKQADTDQSSDSVRLEIGFDSKFHPSLIIRSGLEPVMVNKDEFIAWKSQGVRIDYDPGTRKCSIKELVGGKEMWHEKEKVNTAQYYMTHEARSQIIGNLYKKMSDGLKGSHKYFELGRNNDKSIQGPSEKRFRQIDITSNNAGNFVQ